MTRRRYVMVGGELRDADGVDNTRPTVPVVGDRHYADCRTTDGVDISTRAKHRDYMKRTGLTTVDDYKSEFERKRDQRERFAATGYDPTRREAIVRAIERLNARGRR